MTQATLADLTGREIAPGDREAWLAARRSGIGASEAAAILGVSPHATPLDVYARKVGAAPEAEETEPMRWGKLVEPLIAAEYERRTGRRVARREVLVRHPEAPFLFATLDAVVEGDGGARLLEIKTIGAFAARGTLGAEGTDELPDHWTIQAHHQMACAGAPGVDFAVLLGGQELRLYHVPRTEALIDHLLIRLHAFWQRVERREPPPPTRAEDARTLAALYPDAEGQVDLDAEAASAADRWEALKAACREAEGRRDLARAELLGRLGAAARGRLPDGRVLVRRTSRIPEANVVRAAHTRVDLRIKEGRS